MGDEPGARRRLAMLAAAGLALAGAVAANEPERGTVARCAACHGADGNSTEPGIPSLAGQPAVFVETQLVLFREGLRRSEVMNPEMAGMDDATIVALAKYFAGLTPRAPQEPGDPALLDRGRALAEAGRCGICHLPDFAGRAQIPRLAGQREDYLRATLIAYRDGRRGGADTTMNDVMSGYGDDDIQALAHFLARQVPHARSPGG